MKKCKFRSLINSASALILLFASAVFAQTGGNYQIEKPIIAAGGGASSGGIYALESTSGQTTAGVVSQGSGYSVSNGFWTSSFAPTAANVVIGGRVLTADGGGIQNARVMITFPNGTTQTISTGSFGYYRFNGIPVGESYVLMVFSKRFVFSNPTQIVTVTQELSDLNFIAAP